MRFFFLSIKNRILAFSVDFFCLPASWAISYYLYQDSIVYANLLYALPVFIAIQALTLIVFRLYQGVWRFASISDLLRIIVAIGTSTGIINAVIFLYGMHLPKRLTIINALSLIGLLGLFRLTARVIRERSEKTSQKKRVLVIGAGQAGEMLVRELLRAKNSRYTPTVFLDDNSLHWGKSIHGVVVKGGLEKIEKVVKNYKIESIFIAIPMANAQQMRRIVWYCQKCQMPYKTVPNLLELADGESIQVSTLREVNLQDLLGREQVTLDLSEIEKILSNEIVLITGGGGSIGSELCRQVAKRQPKKLIIIDNNEFNLYKIDHELKNNLNTEGVEIISKLCDINQQNTFEKIVKTYLPSLVFHAAAYKHVPLLEDQWQVAIENNVIGTRKVVEISAKYQVKKFILISSDKAVNPCNVMGATKRAAELICQSFQQKSQTEFIVVRFGNVLDSAGSVVPLFREQLKNNCVLTVTHPDVVRFFMTIPEASQLILQAMVMGNGGEIFVLDMGEPIKIRYLAEQMIKFSGRVLGKDAWIEYIGLRPGEKLYEELFYENEKLKKTSHKKIFLAENQDINPEEIEEVFKKIIYANVMMDEGLLMAYLQVLVKHYVVSGLGEQQMIAS